MTWHWIHLAIAGIFLVSAGFLFGVLWASRNHNEEGDDGQHVDHLHD